MASRAYKPTPPKVFLKRDIVEHMDKLADIDTGRVGKDNVMPSLRNVFIWQEAQAIATSRLKLAWEAAQDPNGPIPNDDRLRRALGESTVITSTRFALCTKVGTPRVLFNRDEFIQLVAKRFKINPEKLLELADQTATESAPPLSKRVIELEEPGYG